MVDAELQEEEVESSWEAAPAIAVVIVAQVVLAIVSLTQDWTLWGLPWWVWLIPAGPELVLLLPLALRRPSQRLEQPPPPDFQFPQMDNPRLAQPGWQAELLDYIYVSYTNSIAFSPTDVLPLTRRRSC
jgi:hypothetical protein